LQHFRNAFNKPNNLYNPWTFKEIYEPATNPQLFDDPLKNRREKEGETI
jgi:hypothetical protein